MKSRFYFERYVYTFEAIIVQFYSFTPVYNFKAGNIKVKT